MNYYERHLGDYAKDTAHLTVTEHGVYTLLLDRYYATEAPIPDDQKYRVARSKSRDEKAAVDAVLAEFFELDGNVWRQKRCDEVIANHHAFIEKQRANGRASAAKRTGNQTPTTVEPPLDSGSNQTDPNRQPPTSHFPLPNERESANAPPPTKVRKPKGTHRVPDDFAPDLEYAKSQLADIDAQREAQRFRDHEFKAARSDWPATWRNWIATCRDTGRYARVEKERWM